MGIKIGIDIQKKNSEMKDCHHQTTSFIAKGVRTAFVIFGIVYVMYGFIKSMQKFQEGNVNIKEEVISQKKFRYPSVTFCYKYKHGTKDVLHNYYPDLYEKWRKSGNAIFISHLIHIYQGVFIIYMMLCIRYLHALLYIYDRMSNG